MPVSDNKPDTQPAAERGQVSPSRETPGRSATPPPKRAPEVIDGIEHRHQSVRLADGSYKSFTVRVLTASKKR